MSSSQTPITRLVNKYSNTYMEYKVLKDLQKRLIGNIRSSDQDRSIPETTGMAPVIVLGMHRSGTTLTSKLLTDLGVSMGRLKGTDTRESIFFQAVNKAVFKLAHAHWDVPEFMVQALDNRAFKAAITTSIAEYCSKANKVRSFTGWGRKASLFSMKYPWGWKDPRTCFTMPVWLDLFPHAKVVYVYRNGVDVAQSLVQRNRRFIGTKYGSVRCLDLAGAYELWEMYNQQCLEHLSSLAEEQVHAVCYEELLQEPLLVLHRLLRFLNLKVQEAELASLAETIQADRAYAFTSDTDLLSFYESVHTSGLMTKFGYSEIKPV